MPATEVRGFDLGFEAALVFNKNAEMWEERGRGILTTMDGNAAAIKAKNADIAKAQAPKADGKPLTEAEKDEQGKSVAASERSLNEMMTMNQKSMILLQQCLSKSGEGRTGATSSLKQAHETVSAIVRNIA